MSALGQEALARALEAVEWGTIQAQTFGDAQAPALVRCPAEGKGRVETWALFPGMTLSLVTLLGQRAQTRHPAAERLLAVSYCRQGRMGWEMGDGESLYLGPGDMAAHGLEREDSAIALPLGYYQGATFFLDADVLTCQPPEVLEDAEVISPALWERFPGRGLAVWPGSGAKHPLFERLFALPEELRLAGYRLAGLELLLHLRQLPDPPEAALNRCRADQLHTVKAIHAYLMDNLEKRITIEELAREYLMNPTTLKAAFKEVYGTSIAAHIREHRMERAAQLLRESQASVAEIARQVGYESQSKLTAAFRETYGVPPTEYRRQG